MKHSKFFIYGLICTFIICGCQSRLLTVYKIDVQQGNALEVETVNQISLGMSKEQVRFALGSPLIVDSFHPDRWDYIYVFTPGYGEEQRRRLTLIFDRDEVIEIYKDNIVEEDTDIAQDEEIDEEQEAKIESDDIARDEASEEKKQEQEELEKQAEELEDILESVNDPTNEQEI